MTPPTTPAAHPAATAAFDRLAPRYDALASGEIFTLLRRRTHAVFARRFHAGDAVLEIGCATGLDTVFLAARGVRVVACDPSEEMVSRALRRLAHEGLTARATVLPCGLMDLASFLEVAHAPDAFDGIVSNFGALNCVDSLAPLGALARCRLRAGGAVLVGVMGRACALEALYLAATGRGGLAGRRRAGGAVPVPVAGVDVPTFYHRICDIRAALGPALRLDEVVGIGVVIPPPYLEPRWQRLPRLVRGAADRLDRWLAPWPPFNRVGDHVLLGFVKEEGHARA